MVLVALLVLVLEVLVPLLLQLLLMLLLMVMLLGMVKCLCGDEHVADVRGSGQAGGDWPGSERCTRQETRNEEVHLDDNCKYG